MMSMGGLNPSMPDLASASSPYEAQLVAAVVDSLAMHLMENARFMAERLNAEFPSDVRALLSCDLNCSHRQLPRSKICLLATDTKHARAGQRIPPWIL
jgi:hypothetical protein